MDATFDTSFGNIEDASGSAQRSVVEVQCHAEWVQTNYGVDGSMPLTGQLLIAMDHDEWKEPLGCRT